MSLTIFRAPRPLSQAPVSPLPAHIYVMLKTTKTNPFHTNGYIPIYEHDENKRHNFQIKPQSWELLSKKNANLTKAMTDKDTGLI